GLADRRLKHLLQVLRDDEPFREVDEGLASGQRALRLDQSQQRVERRLSLLLALDARGEPQYSGGDLGDLRVRVRRANRGCTWSARPAGPGLGRRVLEVGGGVAGIRRELLLLCGLTGQRGRLHRGGVDRLGDRLLERVRVAREVLPELETLVDRP